MRENIDTGASQSSAVTDGHRPLAANGVIGCECGWKPAKRAQRASMAHVSHMAHRRKLGIQPVEYVWPGAMSGLSSGGLMQVSNGVWRNGHWERTN